MRSPTVAELALLARVLVPYAPDKRKRIAGKILVEVELADGRLRATGRLHPHFGDGSLMSHCLALSPIPETFVDDRDFLASLISACEALRDHLET